MLARRYEFYVLVARAISHSFAALTREILFLPLKHVCLDNLKYMCVWTIYHL